MIKLLTNKLSQQWFQVYSRNTLLKRFATVLSIDISVKTSGFLLLPLFLRLMTQEEFGQYNYFISIVQTFSLVLNLGLYIPQSKLYHSYSSKNEKGELLFTITITLILFLLIVLLPIGLFKADYSLVNNLFENLSVYRAYRGVLLLAVLITVFSFMLTNFFYTSEKIKQVKTYNIYKVLLVNAVALVALYAVAGNAVYNRLISVYLTELFLFIFFSYYFIKEMVPIFNKGLMKKCISMGFPIMLSAVFGIVINFSDKFLLQRYGSLKELSDYYLAFSFAGILSLIFSSLQNVWLPVFMKEKDVAANFRKTKRLITKVITVFLFLALAIWLLFVVLILVHIIPEKYNGVILILPLLLSTQIIIAITTLFSNYLVYFEKTNWVSIAGLLVSITSVALGLWLVPLWGVYGAAVTTLIVNFIYLIIYYCLVISLKEKYLKAEMDVKVYQL